MLWNQWIITRPGFTLILGNGQKEFTIVSFNEADPLNGKISNESPLGRALLNHVAGDKIQVNTPKGYVEYTIISVSN